MSDFSQIQFPAVIRLGDKLIPAPKDFMSVWRARCENENILTIAEPKNTGFKWIIQANGQFLQFVELERYRKTPAFFRWLIDFTRVRYKVESPVSLKIIDLKKILKGSKGVIKRDFNELLKKYEDGVVLSKDMFLHEVMKERRDVDIELFAEKGTR